MDEYLRSGIFVNSEHPDVQEFAKSNTKGIRGKSLQAIRLYYAVRDGFKYFPYNIDLNPRALKASALLKKNRGYCIEKANLLAASARALGIPARLGFAIVRNHIGTENLEKILRTDKLVFHGYTELFLEGKWVKATPAFDAALCERMGVHPLEFDGKTDSIFQESDRSGGRFMDYIHDYGYFPDIPYQKMMEEFRKYYPHFFEDLEKDSSERKYKRVFYYSPD